MNREQRRLMQKQGQMTEDGQPAARTRPVDEEGRRTPPSRSGGPKRTSIRQFLHEVNVELRKVAWPTKAEVTNYATVVFLALAVLMALIFVLDLLFSNLASYLFK